VHYALEIPPKISSEWFKRFKILDFENF
jgi:hypothetical protein